MRLRADQLQAHLQKGLAPVYFITGDEPLQVLEAGDAVRARARELGYSDRQVMNVDKGFDWNALAEAGASLSLFAEKRLLELRVTGKPPEAGTKALREYVERLPEDTVLLITCGKLDKKALSTKWAQAVERAGVLIQVWPVEEGQLSDWIARRMRARGMQPSREAVTLLGERVEGNLLAAAQEIDKLLLLLGPVRVELEQVAASVADSSRFNVFGLTDTALAGRADRAVRMVQGLRGEGVAPQLVCWALGREIRALASMAGAAAGGEPLEAVLARHRVWDRRKPLIKGALRRHSPARWYALVRACARAERAIKGAAVGNPWDELIQLTLGLAGVSLLPVRRPA
jgi:DNA polymerase-3 subunit delta